MKRLVFLTIIGILLFIGVKFIMKDYPVNQTQEYQDSIEVARYAAGIDTQTAHIGPEIDTLNFAK